jgi:predicted dehydrogenase
MLRVGIVGFGFMGRMHYRCWRQMEGASVVALCEANPHNIQGTQATQGNIAGAEGDVDLSCLQVYSELKSMLAAERLDAVSITVPTHLHPDCTITALEAGAHVLCEKPIALDLASGRRMIETADRCGRVLQVGHVVRFWPEFAMAKRIVDQGSYGRVLAATFQRLSATAARKAGGWFTDERLSGGMPLDLHIHDTDFIHYLFGMPKAVCSVGVEGAGGLAHMATRYEFGDAKLVTAEGGWAMMPSYGFQMRFHIVLERATIDFDFRQKPTLRICPADADAFSPDLGEGDGYTRQIAYFAQCVQGRQVPTVITARQALDSLRIVEAERESVRRRERMTLG